MVKLKIKNNNKLLFVIAAVIVTTTFVVVNLTQDPFPEQNGLTPFYSIPEKFQAFTGLTLVPSTALNCDSTHSMYYFTNYDNKQHLVSANVEDDIIPNLQLKLVSTPSGNTVENINGEIKVRCDPSSGFVDPQFAGGIVVITVEATKSNGQVVKIKDIQKSLSSTQISVNGKRITVATWSITPDEIESKLDEGNGNYISRVSARVAGTYYFKTFKDENANWKYTIKSGLPVDFGFRKISETTTSTAQDLLVKDRKVELKLLAPTDGSVDLTNNERINIVGSLYGWETAEGYPIIRMYYDDPTATTTEKNTIVLTKTVTSQSGTTGPDGKADFSLSILPNANSKTGKYKITFSSAEKNGSPIRSTVASVPVYFVTTTSPDTPTPKEETNAVVTAEGSFIWEIIFDGDKENGVVGKTKTYPIELGSLVRLDDKNKLPFVELTGTPIIQFSSQVGKVSNLKITHKFTIETEDKKIENAPLVGTPLGVFSDPGNGILQISKFNIRANTVEAELVKNGIEPKEGMIIDLIVTIDGTFDVDVNGETKNGVIKDMAFTYQLISASKIDPNDERNYEGGGYCEGLTPEECLQAGNDNKNFDLINWLTSDLNTDPGNTNNENSAGTNPGGSGGITGFCDPEISNCPDALASEKANNKLSINPLMIIIIIVIIVAIILIAKYRKGS